VNQPPYFKGFVPSTFSIKAGAAANFTLPPLLDVDGDEIISVDVEIAQASVFLTYDAGYFEIKANSTDESMVGIYPIKITVTDSFGSVLESDFILAVMTNIVDEEE